MRFKFSLRERTWRSFVFELWFEYTDTYSLTHTHIHTYYTPSKWWCKQIQFQYIIIFFLSFFVPFYIGLSLSTLEENRIKISVTTRKSRFKISFLFPLRPFSFAHHRSTLELHIPMCVWRGICTVCVCVCAFLYMHVYVRLRYRCNEMVLVFSFSRTEHTHTNTRIYINRCVLYAWCPSALVLLFQLPSCFMCSIYRLCIYRSPWWYRWCVVLLILHIYDSNLMSLFIVIVVFALLCTFFLILCFAIFVRCHYAFQTNTSASHVWTSNAFFHTHTHSICIRVRFTAHDLQIHYAF